MAYKHYEITKEQTALAKTIQRLFSMGETILGISRIEMVAVFAAEIARFSACTDYALATDPEWLANMKEASIKHNVTETLTPCFDTLIINVNCSYEDHAKFHKDAHSKAEEEGEQLLQKVCESHKKKET